MWKRPTTLAISISVGFASGALIGAFAFEMLPKAAEIASVTIAISGFVLGFVFVYALDMFVKRGASAGEKAAQRKWVLSVRQRRGVRSDDVTVLAGGTSAEELIEGLTIGVSAATDPALGLIVGVAIVIDNFSEALSIGDLIREKEAMGQARRIFSWTGLIGVSLFISTIAGWFLLRDVSDHLLGLLLAVGAGAMFYLTVTELVPEAQSHQFEQSSAIAMATGLLAIFSISQIT